MNGSWGELPLDRVVRLVGAGAEAIEAALEPLPDDAPAVVTYRPSTERSSTAVIARLLDSLDSVATSVFPAWLPGAEAIEGPGGTAITAVRLLAARSAAAAADFAPFLADLAERSLTGGRRTGGRFPDEVRAVGLARVVAASYDRTRLALLLDVPDGLTPPRDRALLTACEWFAHHGRAGVWLTGSAPATFQERIRAVAVPVAVAAGAPTGVAALASLAADSARPAVAPSAGGRDHANLPAGGRDHANLPAGGRDHANLPAGGRDHANLPTVSYPAIAGKPHPASAAEQALERALAAQPWSAGRVWNQTYDFGPLVGAIRVDLMWADERCVVEVDGADHRGRKKYADDRQRDLRLLLEGFCVLRFTNEQVDDDPESVLRQIRCFIEPRRRGQWKEQRDV